MTFARHVPPTRMRCATVLARAIGLAVFLTVSVGGYCQSVELQPATPAAAAPRVVTLQEALELARQYSPQFQAARANAAIAHENRLQARDARLPTVNALNQYIYTEGNGTPSGVFIANDGVHVYNEQAVVRENLFGLVRNGQSLEAKAAEAVALAQEEIARRGLVSTVVQRYYALVAAQRKILNGEDSLREAENFVRITTKQEQAGVVSHVDVVKAEMQQEQRTRDLQNIRFSADQAHLALAVLLFAHFDEAFSVDDRIDALPALSSLDAVKVASMEDNPDLRSSRAGLAEAHAAAKVARYAYLPSLAVNFYYGIDANQLQGTATDVFGATKSTQQNVLIPLRQNLGYSGDVTLDVPLWNWGATRSKVRQAESNVHLAEVKAGFAKRQVQADIRSFYQQAQLAREQVASLARSRDLSEENLHLTMLRYQAGEATALEATTAEDSLALDRNAYEDGLVRYYTALAQLQTLTGSL